MLALLGLLFLIQDGYPYRLGVSGNLVFSENDRSAAEYSLFGSARYWNKNVLSLQFDRETRSYPSERFSDEALGVEHFYLLNPSLGLRTTFTKSFGRDFFPDWKAQAEILHFWKDYSFGILGLLKSYPGSDVWSIRPSFESAILFTRFRFQFHTDIEVSPIYAQSFHFHLLFQALPSWNLRAGAGFGKSDEGDGLTDRFTTLHILSRFYIFENLAFLTSAGIYRGDLRDENRVGGGVECSF